MTLRWKVHEEVVFFQGGRIESAFENYIKAIPTLELTLTRLLWSRCLFRWVSVLSNAQLRSFFSVKSLRDLLWDEQDFWEVLLNPSRESMMDAPLSALCFCETSSKLEVEPEKKELTIRCEVIESWKEEDAESYVKTRTFRFEETKKYMPIAAIYPGLGDALWQHDCLWPWLIGDESVEVEEAEFDQEKEQLILSVLHAQVSRKVYFDKGTLGFNNVIDHFLKKPNEYAAVIFSLENIELTAIEWSDQSADSVTFVLKKNDLESCEPIHVRHPLKSSELPLRVVSTPEMWWRYLQKKLLCEFPVFQRSNLQIWLNAIEFYPRLWPLCSEFFRARGYSDAVFFERTSPSSGDPGSLTLEWFFSCNEVFPYPSSSPQEVLCASCSVEAHSLFPFMVETSFKNINFAKALFSMTAFQEEWKKLVGTKNSMAALFNLDQTEGSPGRIKSALTNFFLLHSFPEAPNLILYLSQLVEGAPFFPLRIRAMAYFQGLLRPLIVAGSSPIEEKWAWRRPSKILDIQQGGVLGETLAWGTQLNFPEEDFKALSAADNLFEARQNLRNRLSWMTLCKESWNNLFLSQRILLVFSMLLVLPGLIGLAVCWRRQKKNLPMSPPNSALLKNSMIQREDAGVGSPTGKLPEGVLPAARHATSCWRRGVRLFTHLYDRQGKKGLNSSKVAEKTLSAPPQGR